MEPKILKMKVWHIGEKPVFYGYEEEPSVYSIIDQAITNKPSHLDLMSRRDIMPSDLSSVIMHNQMSQEDFECLDSKKLIPEDVSLFFRKIQNLKKEVEALKSLTSEPVAKSDESPSQPIGTPTPEGIAAIIELIKGGMSGNGSSVFEQIKSSTSGLSENDKKIIELIGSHFGLSNASDIP